MTRSRSSELRYEHYGARIHSNHILDKFWRRYAAMQCARTNTGVEAMQDVSGHGVNNLKHEFGNPNGFTSSSSTFNTPQIENETAEDSFHIMLKKL
ncbi:hypothetical protein OIU76_018043 [Salix suchowensis]|nr:hypothetical protein OIU76_018043 [Salix suchowensis]